MTLLDVTSSRSRTDRQHPAAPPTALLVFGATGDLAQRKLLPALYNLAHDQALPADFSLIGTAPAAMSDDAFRQHAAEAVRQHSRRAPDEALLTDLLRDARYVSGRAEEPTTYDELARALAEIDGRGRAVNRALYLSTSPQLFLPIVERLGASGLHAHDEGEVHLIIEKPFGRTLAEARDLNATILATFGEASVFRVDHYLGKETVQNILTLRFANALFEPIWNRNAVSRVEITAAEEIGIGTRASFYDGIGALRDLVQNHLLQLLCMLCMEPPIDLSAEAIRDEKVKVLQAIRIPTPSDTVRAQYTRGVMGRRPVNGYHQEDGVAPGSSTETYAALRLHVDNWRWAGVPLYLRTGKRLARKATEIAVTFRPVPHSTFGTRGLLGVEPNQLILRVQPDQGMSIRLASKAPGTGLRIESVDLAFQYGTSFGTQSPEAYERLLLDAMRGDPTLFTRSDEIEAQWRVCDPVQAAWSADEVPLARYAAGSQGPAEADALFPGDSSWRAI